MAVRIRLSRIGRLNRPFYRIGVYDSRTRRDGKILDHLGFYDPILSTGKLWQLDVEKLGSWLKRGALPSGVIASYLRTQKIAYSDSKGRRAGNKERATGRKAARRRTGRTVEKSIKPFGGRK